MPSRSRPADRIAGRGGHPGDGPGRIADETTRVTDQSSASNVPSVPDAARRARAPLARTFVWLGIAGASAALTFLILRASMSRPQPGDETTERIQALIDEANQLIKTLDEKKST